MGRSRGGVKVPNVKLRPADPKQGPSKRNVIESDEEEVDVMDPRMVQLGRAVFKGVVICATGIKNKREVFEKVRRMGGTHTTDLTDLTTHLIAEEPGSEKYRCAVERDIAVVTTSWIEEAHERWLNGDSFPPDSFVDAHRLPPFRGMRICITGIETADQRVRIHKLTKKYGGEYLKSLDKTCTHVLCCVETSEKIQWVIKQNTEREVARSRPSTKEIPPSIHLLWVEWFWDSVYKQGLLPHEPYYITNPRPEPMSQSIMNSPEVYTVTLPPGEDSRALPAIVPLASLLSDSNDMTLPVKRRKGETERHWESIRNRHTTAIPTKSAQGFGMGSVSMQINDDPISTSTSPMKKSWTTKQNGDSVSNWNRRSPMKRRHANGSHENDPTRKVSAIQIPSGQSTSSKARPGMKPVADSFLGKFRRTNAFDETKSLPRSEPATPLESPTAKVIFLGKAFRLMGDASCDRVSAVIQQAGGVILQEGMPDYFVVRLVGGSEYFLNHPETERSRFRTECWLERSLFEGRMCEPAENITFTPLVMTGVTTGRRDLLVASSGLDSFERTWTSRLFRLLDIAITPSFSSQCTHLLCPTNEGLKCVKAKEWAIPVVGLDWVVELAKAATTAPNTRPSTPTLTRSTRENETDGKVEQSLEALQLEKGGVVRKPPSNGLVFSPVFNITSRSPLIDNGLRPPSPTSPSPQRRRLLSINTAVVSPQSDAAGGIQSANGVMQSSGLLPTPLTNGRASPLKSPAKPPVTQPIPSSATPSPLATRIMAETSKTRESMTGPRISGLSSTQEISAKSLSRNIGAILGSKRAVDDDVDGDTNSTTSGAEGPRKRPRRPPPSRPKNPDALSPRKLGQAPPLEAWESGVDPHIAPEGLLDAPPGGIAISYKDPSEIAEQQRLLRMVHGSGPEPAMEPESGPATEAQPQKVAKMKPRRSGRQRGYV